MINRDNYKLTRKYLEWYADVKQVSPGTYLMSRSALRHLLEWADDTSFSSAKSVSPTFPRYLSSLGIKDADRTCHVARSFFTWLKRDQPRLSNRLDDLWLETLRQVRGRDMVGSHDAYTLDEIRLIVGLSSEAMIDRRTRAAVAMLFISGMRIGAFVTLPLKAVDLSKGEIRQWPDLGVRTKGSVRATTYLLNIPDLMVIISDWDDLVRSILSEDDMWYAPLTSGSEIARSSPKSNNRQINLLGYIRKLCKSAGVRYRNPHQIRHAHAMYALSLCRDMADYKAVSINLMHSDIAVTDRIYAEMSAADVKNRIENLGGK